MLRQNLESNRFVLVKDTLNFRTSTLHNTLFLAGFCAIGVFFAYQFFHRDYQKTLPSYTNTLGSLSKPPLPIQKVKYEQKTTNLPARKTIIIPHGISNAYDVLDESYSGAIVDIRQLDVINDLLIRSGLNDIELSMSSEEVSKVNQLINKLVLMGHQALPVITGFLQTGEDINFDSYTGSDGIAHHTLRLGLIHTLNEIGTPEAIEALAEVLRETARPEEISLLAHSLEANAPGVYREEILTVTEETIADLYQKRGALAKNQSGPLFSLLQHYGDMDSVPLLLQLSSNWQNDSLVALTGLPNGAGIPALINNIRSQTVAEQSPVALALLAQAAIKNTDAGNTLIDLARVNGISKDSLIKVALALKGYELYFSDEYSRSDNLDNSGLVSLGASEEGDRKRLMNYQHLKHKVNGIERSSEEDNAQRLKLITQLLDTELPPTVARLLDDTQDQLI